MKTAVLLSFMVFCCSAGYAQVPGADSVKNRNTFGKIIPEPEKNGLSELHLSTPESADFFFLQQNSFIFNTNLNNNTNLNTIPGHSLYFSQPFSLNAFNDSKSRMFGSLYNIYSQNKPGKMQQILGMVQLSGAAVLAGYHIYKYYIKEKK